MTALAGLILLANVSVAPPARQSIELDSGWTAQVTPDRQTPPSAGRWEPTKVPGFFRYNPRGGSKDVWYRRPVSIPAGWRDRRIVLDLRSARYWPRVFLDGKLVGERLDGWSPLEVDLTPFARPGSTHELVVQCQDYGALLAEGTVWPEHQGDEAIRGKVLAPIGGYKDQMGLVSPVFLRSTPKNRIVESDLVIRTSVRRGELEVRGTSQGRASRIVAEVWDGARRVLRSATTAGPAWHLKERFPKPRYWSPEDPHLYDLRVSLMDDRGRVLDRVTERFGFREFWSEGPDFFLNGVRRHLFGSSTWPVQQWLSPEVIRQRLRAVKASGVDTFRLHIGPWQEEFAEVADEIGLLIVTESAVYTDQGSYAYRDERFWKNFRDHLEGMVRRDWNRPSVIMWSLGNEILFMGNERFDPDLPKKLGALAPFVKALDPTRPTTFEADIDPDGKYDVIGLHYPHELPNVYAYPEAADWLGSRKLTEAGGGMLGQRSTRFQWDRRKPLYIGEYLWVPHGDYSPGSVYFGDEAYRNRDRWNTEARAQSWIDQTIAYRRSGVSALCPWTVFDFGVGPAQPTYLDAQSTFYKRQMAWLRDKGLRFFAGERAPLRFDVFNDGLATANMTLQLLDGDRVVDSRQVRLSAAGYADLTLAYRAPLTDRKRERPLELRLLADGRTVDSKRLNATVEPKAAMPPGIVVFDPSGRWPGAVTQIPSQPAVLVIAPGALDAKPRADGLPVVGGTSFDADRFRRFLERGGRCVVLEQQNLAPLGLGLTLVEHASTMTFALDRSHPVLRGLGADDLRHWRGDGYVSRREILRDGVPGLCAITVSGGPESLAQAPIAELAIGQGHVLLMQALVGTKRTVDPAARRLLSNAIEYLSGLPSRRTDRPVVVGSGPAVQSLRQMGLEATFQSSPLSVDRDQSVTGVVLVGGGSEVIGSAPALAEAVRRGVPVYWVQPTPEAFRGFRQVLGATGLRLQPAASGPTLGQRPDALLRGVSREDLIFTTPPAGWDRVIRHKAAIASGMLVPEAKAEGALQVSPAHMKLESGRVVLRDAKPVAFFDRIGSFAFQAHGPAGTRLLTLEVHGTPADASPVLEVRVNDESIAWIEVPAGWSSLSLPIPVPSGAARVSVHFINGARWGGPMTVLVRGAVLSKPLAYPEGVRVLAHPASLVAWKQGRSTIVIDTLDPWRAPEDTRRGHRYVGAMLANLGFSFAPPSEHPGDALPNARFTTAGGRYNTADAARIELRSTGHAEVEFACGHAGTYELVLVASSTPADGRYAIVRAELDGAPIGEKEIATATDRRVSLGTVRLAAGKHRLRLIFPNDASNDREDRNLVIRQVSFVRVP